MGRDVTSTTLEMQEWRPAERCISNQHQREVRGVHGHLGKRAVCSRDEGVLIDARRVSHGEVTRARCLGDVRGLAMSAANN